MLQNLLHILFVSAICLSWGLPIVMALQKKNIVVLDFGLLILCFFAGISLLGLIVSYISLFLPLNFWQVSAPTIILCAIEGFFFRKRIKLNLLPFRFGWLSLFGILGVTMILFLSSGNAVMEDTGIYHIQLVRWNQQFAPVHGLANVYLRYGFFSNWFHLMAALALPFKNENFLFLNATLSIWFLFFLLNKLQYCLKESSPVFRILGIYYFLVLGYMFLQWHLLRGNASSTSYDFIVTCLFLLVSSLVIERTLLQRETNLTLIILLAASAPFFKLTGALLLPVIFLFFALEGSSLKTYLRLFLAVAVFLVPFLVKNYFQTGYACYPYTIFSSILHPDWKVPPELMVRFSDYITIGNKYINQSIPADVWHQPDKLSLAWLAPWLRNLIVTDKLIFLALSAGLLVSFFTAAFRKQKKIQIFYYPCYALLPIWLFSSPDPRFIYGLLIFLSFLPLAFLFARLFERRLVNIMLVALSCGLIYYSTTKLRQFDSENFFHPVNVLIPTHQVLHVHDINFYLPERTPGEERTKCYDTPLPCIYQFNPYLEPRGTQIKDGFRMKPIADSNFILEYHY